MIPRGRRSLLLPFLMSPPRSTGYTMEKPNDLLLFAGAMAMTLLLIVILSLVHESFHLLTSYLLGWRAHLVVVPNDIYMFRVVFESTPPPRDMALIALSGSLSLAVLPLLNYSLRASSRTSLVYSVFAVSDLLLNVFTDLGDGMYLPFFKLPRSVALAVLAVRIVAFNLYGLSLTSDIVSGTGRWRQLDRAAGAYLSPQPQLQPLMQDRSL